MAIEGLYTSTGEDATVRLFVSSTFRDMDAGCEELIKRVFPKLRRLCKGRGLAWTDVQSPTEEQVERGELLPTCFAEIRTLSAIFHRVARRTIRVDSEASFPKPLSTATLGSLITQQPAL